MDDDTWEMPQNDVVYYSGDNVGGSIVYYMKSSGTLSVASTAIMTGLSISELLTVRGYGTSDDGLTQSPIGQADLAISVTLSSGTVNLTAGADFYGSSNPYLAEVTFI